MNHIMIRAAVLAVGAVTFALAAVAAEQSGTMSDKMGSMSGPMVNMAGGDAKLIASAMSAAPHAISADATIVAMDAGGKMRTLRQGSNGWTCMPDDPQTPGKDPTCGDKNSMEIMAAMMAHKPPPQKVGLMYMLQGGSDASNTDPYATKPAGGKWIKTGPHIMIMGAGKAFLDQYPKGADPDTKAPYVMWAGTPYEHLMVPVK